MVLSSFKMNTSFFFTKCLRDFFVAMKTGYNFRVALSTILTTPRATYLGGSLISGSCGTKLSPTPRQIDVIKSQRKAN